MVPQVLAIAASTILFLSMNSAARLNNRATRLPVSGLVHALAPVPAAQSKAGPEIERLLHALEGSWSIIEDLSPGATSGNGKQGIGKIVFRPGPGGFSMLEDYSSKQGDEQVTGLGMFWWDEAAHGYHTIWCDSTNPTGCIDFENTAKWQDSRLVLENNYVLHGKSYTFKEVFEDITADAFTQTLYGGEVGGPLKADQIIRARRVGSN